MLVPVYRDREKTQLLGYVDTADLDEHLPRIELGSVASIDGEYVTLHEAAPFGPAVSQARLPRGDLAFSRSAQGFEVTRRPEGGDFLVCETLDEQRLRVTAEVPEVWLAPVVWDTYVPGPTLLDVVPKAGNGLPKALAKGDYLVEVVGSFDGYDGLLEVQSAPSVSWFYSATFLPRMVERDLTPRIAPPSPVGSELPPEVPIRPFARDFWSMQVSSDLSPGTAFQVLAKGVYFAYFTFTKLTIAAP